MLVGCAAVVVAFTPIVSNGDLRAWAVIALLAVVLRLGRSYIRQAQPTLESVRATDPEWSVVYLRSFKQERAVFSQTDRASERSALGAVLALITSHLPLEFETLDVYLGRHLYEAIGPLVAIGYPEDLLPAAGAFRGYPGDDAPDGGAQSAEAPEKWKVLAGDLIAKASCILMGVGVTSSVTSGLAWELGEIRTQKRADRLFIVTSPYGPIGSARVMPFRARLLNKLRRVPTPDWNGFREIAESTGYRGLPAKPEPGSVITFTQARQAIVLATGASTAAEYVGAVASALQQVDLDRPVGA